MKHRRFRILPECIRGREAVMEDRDEIRHMTRVLRLRPGDRVSLFDGEGKEYAACIRSVSPDRVSFSLLPDPLPAGGESALAITLGMALLKSSRFEWLLEKATELGVSEIIPFYSRHVIPKEKERGKSLGRWEKIASAAAKQCGRSRVPRVNTPRSFEEILSADRGGAVKIFLWEREESRRLSQGLEKTSSAVFALVGPEGGFSEEEARRAIEAGFRPVRLGPRILRAETAGVMIVGLLQYLWGDLSAGP